MTEVDTCSKLWLIKDNVVVDWLIEDIKKKEGAFYM